MKIAFAVLKGVALAVAVIVITGCTLSVKPDGSRTWTPEPETFLRAIEIIAEK